MTTLVIVDDQELVRTGLRMILEVEPDLEILGEAADGREAVDRVRDLRPDLVLMDVQMPGMDGIEATRALVQNGAPECRPRVIVLTTFDQSEIVYDALTAGASGFLLKDMPGEQLVAGVRAVARGEELLAPAITRRLIETFFQHAPVAPPRGYDELTPRERDIFMLLAQGLANSEIAAELVVSDATVKTHVAHILSKLAVRDRVQAVILAYETGLVRPVPPSSR